jgi:hypothetical protein
MNNQITTADRSRMISDLIAEIDAHIDAIQDMTDDGFVLMFETSGYCVNTDSADLCAGSVTRATIYTQENLDACEKYGVGIPPYRDGTGEFAKLVSLRDAKWRQIADASRAIENFIKYTV